MYCGKGTTYFMDVKQLRNLLKLGSTRTVVIYCDLCIDYIGYVKTITIMNEKTVRLEYNTYGYDEGGLTYFVEYEDFGTLLKSMQEYLESDINKWKNISLTSDYPQELERNFDINITHRLIIHDLLNNKLKLPKYGNITMKEGYWKHLYNKNIDKDS